VVFTLIAALQTCRAQAEQSDFADIDHFFHANYNLTNLAEYAKRPVGDISYLLVSWREYNDVQQRYLDGGYVKLGESYYASTGGIPENDAAIRYARSIGAEAVVYTLALVNGKFEPLYWSPTLRSPDRVFRPGQQWQRQAWPRRSLTLNRY
jgi:hypothetical protein